MTKPVMHELHRVNMSFEPSTVGAAVRLFRLRQYWPLSFILPDTEPKAIASVDDRPERFRFRVVAVQKMVGGGYEALLCVHGLHGLKIRDDIARCHNVYTLVAHHDSGVSYTNHVLAIAAEAGKSNRGTAWNVLSKAGKVRSTGN